MIQNHGPQELLRGVSSAGRRLVRVHPGATVRGIADDLGIERGTLRHWLDPYGTGKKTAADGTLTRSPPKPALAGRAPLAGSETPEQEARPAPRPGSRSCEAETTKLDHRAGDPAAGGQVFRRGDGLVNRFQFVADHPATFEVKRLCELVEIERSSYYAWQAAAPARRSGPRPTPQLAERIRAVHEDDNTCGAPRITAELNDGTAAGERVNHKRVARVMREHGIRRLLDAAPGPHHDPRARGAEGARPAQAGLHRRRRRTSATSATSPTCRWPTGRTCTWPP